MSADANDEAEDYGRAGCAHSASGLRAAAVLLAAGMSRRMGDRNKLLIEIEGEPLVRRCAKVYLAAGVKVHAVLGHEAERVRAALAGLPISFAVNPQYAQGKQTSARAGLASLADGFDAVLVALADQPALTSADVAGLLQAFDRNGRTRVIVPYFCENRGNPVAFPAGLIAEMRRQGRNAASREFVDGNPELVTRFEAGHGRFTIDIDTPDDLASFAERPQSRPI